MTERAELLTAWEHFQRSPIPSLRSDNDTLREMRIELVEFDAWAVGLISHVVGRSEPPQQLHEDADLRARIEQYASHENPAIAGDAQRLGSYLAGLHDLIGLARRTPL